MPTTLLQLSGGLDFTQKIAKQGYEISEGMPVEKSSTVQSSGYRKRTLATNGLTTIKVKFVGGMDKDTAYNFRNAFNVNNMAEFIYWSPLHGRMRKAKFFVTMDPINVYLQKADSNFLYSDWGVTLEQADVSSDINPTIVSAYPSISKDQSDSTWKNIDNVRYVFQNGGHIYNDFSKANINNVLRLGGFGFNIPSGAVINQVSIEMQYYLSTTSSAVSVNLEAAYNGTKRGTTKNSTAEPLPQAPAIISTTACGTWTADDLNNDNAQIKIGYMLTSSKECIINVNYVKMTVSYTEVGD